MTRKKKKKSKRKVSKRSALKSKTKKFNHDPKRIKSVLGLLQKEYPDANCALHHNNPLQLLIATILSAQCTDKRVNQVTPALFERYPDAKAFAQANPDELEDHIRSTGFFRNKTQNIINCCRAITEKHGGQVPQTMEKLTELGGVGRKTANVVLGNAFKVNVGVVVDTHVQRLSGRLGLTQHKDPKKIEQDLMQIIPQKDWTLFAHYLILHGRKVCNARKPKCDECNLNQLCPSSLV